MLDKILLGILATVLGVFLLSAGYVVGHITKKPETIERTVEKPIKLTVERTKVLDKGLDEALEFLLSAEEASIFIFSNTRYQDGNSYPVRNLTVEILPAGSNITVKHVQAYRAATFNKQDIVDHILKVKKVHSR